MANKELPPAPDEVGVSVEHFSASLEYYLSALNESIKTGHTSGLLGEEITDDPSSGIDIQEFYIWLPQEPDRSDSDYSCGTCELEDVPLSDALAYAIHLGGHDRAEKVWQSLVYSFEKAKEKARKENAHRSDK